MWLNEVFQSSFSSNKVCLSETMSDDRISIDHRGSSLNASGSVLSRTGSGDVATFPPAAGEDLRAGGTSVQASMGMGATSERATDEMVHPVGPQASGLAVRTGTSRKSEDDDSGGSFRGFGESGNVEGFGEFGSGDEGSSDGFKSSGGGGGLDSVWNVPRRSLGGTGNFSSPLRTPGLLAGLKTDKVNKARRTESRLRNVEATVEIMDGRIGGVESAVKELSAKFDRMEQLLQRWEARDEEMQKRLHDIPILHGAVDDLQRQVDQRFQESNRSMRRVEEGSMAAETSVKEISDFVAGTTGAAEAIRDEVFDMTKRMNMMERVIRKVDEREDGMQRVWSGVEAVVQELRKEMRTQHDHHQSMGEEMARRLERLESHKVTDDGEKGEEEEEDGEEDGEYEWDEDGSMFPTHSTKVGDAKQANELPLIADLGPTPRVDEAEEKVEREQKEEKQEDDGDGKEAEVGKGDEDEEEEAMELLKKLRKENGRRVGSRDDTDFPVPTSAEHRMASEAGVLIRKWKKNQHTVIAAKDIPKGYVIVDYAAIPFRSGDDLRYAVESEDGKYDGRTPQGFHKFINHSCQPNAILRCMEGIYEGIPQFVVIALRDIEPGEEIGYDYQWTVARGATRTQCECGHPGCRGYVEEYRVVPDGGELRITAGDLVIPLGKTGEREMLREKKEKDSARRLSMGNVDGSNAGGASVRFAASSGGAGGGGGDDDDDDNDGGGNSGNGRGNGSGNGSGNGGSNGGGNGSGNGGSNGGGNGSGNGDSNGSGNGSNSGGTGSGNGPGSCGGAGGGNDGNGGDGGGNGGGDDGGDGWSSDSSSDDEERRRRKKRLGQGSVWGTPKSPAFRGATVKTPAVARAAAEVVAAEVAADNGKTPTLRKADVPKWETASKDPRDWLTDYEEYAELMGWPEEFALRAVTVAMKYQRGKTWHRKHMKRRDAGLVKPTWEAWKKAFLNTFVDESFDDDAFQAWMDCKQTGGENVSHFSERYEAAVLRVQESHDEPIPRWETKIVKRYVEGLRKDLRSLVAAKTFASVEAAVQYALKMEKWQRGDDEEAVRPRFKARTSRKVGAVKAEEEPVKTVAAAKPVATPAAVSRDPRTCYGCGQKGHLKYQCPKSQGSGVAPRPAARGIANGGAVQGGMRCYVCDEVGHRAVACPRKQHVFCVKCRQPGHVANCCRQPPAQVPVSAQEMVPAQVAAAAPQGQAPAPQQRD